MKHTPHNTLLIITLCSHAIWLNHAQAESNWVDQAHDTVSDSLQGTAEKLDSLFGSSPEGETADAKMRILIDNSWNKYDDYTIKTRFRGRVRLPALEDRLHLVFGDDRLDESLKAPNELLSEKQVNPSGKTLSYKQVKEDNDSIGLQWKLHKEETSWRTRVGLGLRTSGDIYAKLKTSNTWQYSEDTQFNYRFLYRLGTKSKHEVQNTFNLQYAPYEQPVTSNQLRVTYKNNEIETWEWGNSLSRKHAINDHSWYNYGVYLGGDIADQQATINTYGPFVGAYYNLYEDWLFVQGELTYYNNKKEDRKHHLGALLRFEAKF